MIIDIIVSITVLVLCEYVEDCRIENKSAKICMFKVCFTKLMQANRTYMN